MPNIRERSAALKETLFADANFDRNLSPEAEEAQIDAKLESFLTSFRDECLEEAAMVCMGIARHNSLGTPDLERNLQVQCVYRIRSLKSKEQA
jgi:hypothetical protein